VDIDNNEKLLQGGEGSPAARGADKNFLEKGPPTIIEVLPILWKSEVKHAVIVGEGGMGKTVSLIQWWENLLGPGEKSIPVPVPVSIALNEFNQVSEAKREGFILETIRKGECVKTLVGHTDKVTSAVYSGDGKKILSASADQTIKEWDAGTGECLNTYIKKYYYPDLSEYPTYKAIKELRTDGNKIIVPAAPGEEKALELLNIPGLFIQGCSFRNLEKGSQWTREGLEILKQYGALL
jgi:WD40 repeat protein